MRISDWSSDVFSSDLIELRRVFRCVQYCADTANRRYEGSPRGLRDIETGNDRPERFDILDARLFQLITGSNVHGEWHVLEPFDPLLGGNYDFGDGSVSASLTELPASTTAGAVWAQAAVDINCAINATKEAFLIAITLTSPDDRQIESRRP